MVEMLESFDAFCNEKGLRYYLAYGTLIGALRHKGFIPWDDDADIMMPREDYEKLLEWNRIDDNTLIVSNHNPQGCWHPFCYANLIDTRTSMISAVMGDRSGKGVFVDVFPIDSLPDKKEKETSFFKKLHFLNSLLWLSVSDPSNIKGKSPKNTVKRFVSFIMSRVNTEKLQSKIESEAQRYNSSHSHLGLTAHYIGHVWGVDFGDMSSFEPFRVVPFHDIKLRVPAQAEKILETIYGDYMTPPSEDERKGHHYTKFFYKE